MLPMERLLEPMIALPRAVKRTIVLLIDAGLAVLTVWLALYLRTGEFVALTSAGWPAAVVAVLLAVPIFSVAGLYRSAFRYIGSEALTSIVQAILAYGVIYCAIFMAFGVPGVPRTLGIIQPILLFVAIGTVRVLGRYWLGSPRRRRQFDAGSRAHVLIYGAGTIGRQLALALAESHDVKLVGFVDDARDLQGSVIGGVRVFGPDRLQAVVDKYGITQVYLALSSATRTRRNEILQMIRSAGVGVKTLPGLLDIAAGKVTISDLKPLEIEDLLGREAVAPDPDLLLRNIRDKTVLVTGAGGSIGGELCRQILAIGPARLLLVDASEYALYGIHKELEALAKASGESKVELIPLLASVCDQQRMRRIFSTWRPDTIYHAAAYKHVPLVEHNLVEGVRNNVIGTATCATLADEFGAGTFVLISTDKAVRPTNIMGASKRISELVLQALATRNSRTCFSMVRFGNVLGSSGSVVPLFRAQIAAGGPVTVTHGEMTRYFMLIPEAAQLVIQAGAMAKGGEVFLLDMGQPVRILDLAKKMIALSGREVRSEENPQGDIEIHFTGLRPGEKLYEELLIGDNAIATEHPRILMANEGFIPFEELRASLARLQQFAHDHDVLSLASLIAELVPEYVPAHSIEDWLYCAGRNGEANATARIALVATGSKPAARGFRSILD